MSTILAIESAVAGGSVSVIRNGIVEAKWAGDGEVSSAEEVLPAVDRVLDRALAKLEDIDTIAVSNGPGSFTGIRIGIATASGLARSSRARCVGLSLLDAIAFCLEIQPPYFVAVPFGRSDVVSQLFTERTSGTPAAETMEGFITTVLKSESKIASAGKLLGTLTASLANNRLVDVGSYLSSYVGQAVSRGFPAPAPAPFYVKKT